MPTGQFTPQLVAEQQPARRVDDEDPAGPEPGAPHTRTVRERDGPRLGRDRHESVIGDGDRSGRSPLRSSAAPHVLPSVKQSAAGPSHGSLSIAP